MIQKRDFLRLIGECSFKELFVTELGWNRYRAQSELPTIAIDDIHYNITAIAERNGFQILTCNVDELPSNSDCRKIDTKLRKQANDYICIFTERDTTHHLWVVPVKNNEKRDLTFVEYATIDQADLLYSKVEGFSFELGEETNIVDVRAKVHKAFIVNNDKITKDFYTGFRKQHKAFTGFITGIDDNVVRNNRKKEWYASVMLNRLMFCYFIQKKGFLNGDFDYLRHKLEWVKREQGEDRFFDSFYKGFLVQLFHDGLNAPRHTPEWERTYGKIPYLNGGMFDIHELEQEYADIDISDEAFEQLFTFFDSWRWHLDTRITASGKDINPDVLGYIFEQYINDRSAMGAYYTKEDITEYIGKNCILPFLMDRLAETDAKAFKTDGEVWAMLRESGDRYIYDAIKRGYSPDWQRLIPEEIAKGLDTSKPNLLDRRSQWNTTTPDQWALPTESWRETIERLQRCESLLGKITRGEIIEVNDFITHNLDIRSFVYDLLATTSNHLLVKHFYHALQRVTILDPTCGSGAFLFAAMNILEPLYEVCLERMHEWNEQNPALFKKELTEISNNYRSNIQYFIFKSIILRNLYGVDIMVEATEIAKLRLFLKMVAVVEVDRRADNMGLDPLPDIDFNIRSGNTLVGYATEEQLNADLSFAKDIMEQLANQEFKGKIDQEMQNVATTFNVFKDLQLTQETDLSAFKSAKNDLRTRLGVLNDLLNKRLFSATGTGDYGQWIASHQPFHWLAEFYQIMHDNGGFDVIIGNPPYVSIGSIQYISSTNLFNCSDLYGFVIKRCYEILSENGRHGFIVMHNLAFSRNFRDVRKEIFKNSKSQWFSFFSRIPSGLFDGNVRVRNTIYITSSSGNQANTTRLHRWFTEQRESLFQNIHYSLADIKDVIPMLNDSILQVYYENKIGENFISHSSNTLFVKKTAYNCLAITNIAAPTYDEDGSLIESDASLLNVRSEYYEFVQLLLCGKFMFTRWLTYGDDFHLTLSDVSNFIFPFDKISSEDQNRLKQLYHSFSDRLPDTLQYKRNAGKNVGNYNVRDLWDITDESDLIFLKYISDNPLNVFQIVENYIAASVISDKK